MGKQEIRCPHCNNYTEWQGNLDDRCLHCGGLIQEKEIEMMNLKNKAKEIKEAEERKRIEKQHPFQRIATKYLKITFISFVLILAFIIAATIG